MKTLKTILVTSILIMTVASCSNDKPMAVETTATTIDYGDCGEAADTMWEKHGIAIEHAWQLDKGNYNVNVQAAFENERQFIRRLNIPFMQSQQLAYVNAYTNLIDSYNIYWANPTNSNWLQVNRAIISHQDAYHNFRDTWNPLCDDDYPYPEDLFITDPTSSNLPYPGYNDTYDQDCIDIRRKVWVGSYDPDNLDEDGNGWGCETYGL